MVVGEVHKAVLEMLRDTEVRCIKTRRVLPEEGLEGEMAGSGDEAEEGGRALQHTIPLLLFWETKGIDSFLVLSFVCSISFLCPRVGGEGEKGTLL